MIIPIFIPTPMLSERGAPDPIAYILLAVLLFINLWGLQVVIVSLIAIMFFNISTGKVWKRNLIPGFFVVEFFVYIFNKREG